MNFLKNICITASALVIAACGGGSLDNELPPPVEATTETTNKCLYACGFTIVWQYVPQVVVEVGQYGNVIEGFGFRDDPGYYTGEVGEEMHWNLRTPVEFEILVENTDNGNPDTLLQIYLDPHGIAHVFDLNLTTRIPQQVLWQSTPQITPDGRRVVPIWKKVRYFYD